MKVRAHILSPSVGRGIAVLCAAVVVAGAPSSTRAAGVVGTGSAASCTDAALNAALTGGGLVTFDCGGPATIDISTGTGTKTIAADTTVDGAGLITISGGNTVGVFSVASFNFPGVKFSVNNLTIANGLGRPTNHSAGGGGIFNGGGTLTVTDSIFTGNSAPACRDIGCEGGGILNSGGALTVTDTTFMGNSSDYGGAISNRNGGTLTVTNSTFTENSATSGGGISNNDVTSTTLTVTNSTFTGNSAIVGGGIFTSSGTLTVTNSTFIGNSASAGGCISTGGTLTVTNSTFTGNNISAGHGGIIENFPGNGTAPVLLRNTIVANNTGGNCGHITDGGHNLDSGTSCGFSASNGSLSNTDPQLDPAGLQNNGGPTQTVALCTAVGVPAGCSAASPAIDAGDQAVCATAPVNDHDQRGLLRPGSGHTNCSIGAYEADATVVDVCTGDCGGTGSVAINDLITLVNIDLGNAQPAACPHGVPSGAEVNVALLIQAVNNTLDGCPAPLVQCGNGMLDGDEDCDDGNTAGGDGCAANCTREDRRTYPIIGASVRVLTDVLRIPLSLSGQEILTTGRARASSGAGVLPVVIRAEDVQFAPIRLGSLVCLCLRAVAAPELGPGNAGRGEIGCGPQGLPDVNVAALRDHDISDVDPPCATGFGEDGSPAHPHAGACNGPLRLMRSGGPGPRGSALITMNLAVGFIEDAGTCRTVPPNTPDAPQGPDGIPCTADDPSPGIATSLLATTGTARAEVLDANDFAGERIGSDDQCGSPPCVTEGVPFDCDALAAQPSGGVASGRLVNAVPFLDVHTFGDTINTGAPFPLRDFPTISGGQ